jgi:D-glycero-D-manno-heptose 1,7-bisphosphate phosphatase
LIFKSSSLEEMGCDTVASLPELKEAAMERSLLTGEKRSLLTGEKMVLVLYLDLDGTVRKGKGELGRFVNGVADVEVFPEARAMMLRWKENGGRCVGVSNQGGVALGHFTQDQCALTMMETQKQCDSLFDMILWCCHHPFAATPEMARCWCRKPSPGMVIEGALELARMYPGEIYPPHLGMFVGDRPEDRECAELAGLDFEWAHRWRAEANG